MPLHRIFFIVKLVRKWIQSNFYFLEIFLLEPPVPAPIWNSGLTSPGKKSLTSCWSVWDYLPWIWCGGKDMCFASKPFPVFTPLHPSFQTIWCFPKLCEVVHHSSPLFHLHIVWVGVTHDKVEFVLLFVVFVIVWEWFLRGERGCIQGPKRKHIAYWAWDHLRNVQQMDYLQRYELDGGDP